MLQRIISALVLIPAAVYIVHIGGLPLTLLAMLLSIGGLREFFDFCDAKGIKCFRIPAYAVTLIYYVNVHFRGAFDGSRRFEFSPVLILGFVFLILWLQAGKKVEGSIAEISTTVFGYLYVSVFISFTVYIRRLEFGEQLLFTIILLVWAADTFAYFGGRAFGRKKLSPEISPKKSVEGVYCGLAASMVVSMVLFRFYNIPAFTAAGYLGFTLFLNVFAVLGDLIESQFKRDCAIKDSSALIPGHGGILDRIDSQLLVMPVSYYFYLMLA